MTLQATMASRPIAVQAVLLLLASVGRIALCAPSGNVLQVTDVAQCAQVSTASITPTKHTLTASVKTVNWGYYYSNLDPVAVVTSGDEIFVEMITQHAGDDPAKMIIGDPALEQIYLWNSSGPQIALRGRTGHGDGVHILTGPIYVCGAEAGDVLQVDILDLTPRINPGINKTYGSNAAPSWGFQFRAGFLDGITREVITIYEILRDAAGDLLWAVPDYQFVYGNGYPGSPFNYTGPVTNCTVTEGYIQNAANGEMYEWTDYARTYRGNASVPCVNNTMSWSRYLYPGLLTQHPTGTEDYSIRGKFRVPINFHIGNMGVASATNVTVDSVPPSLFGGNVDDRRIGKGATMYYPVQVAGAMLSMGDAHTAMGDSELDGTGIETSINGQFKITLHKKASLPAFLQSLNFPLLENANEYIVHAFTNTDYVKNLAVPNDIYSQSSLDPTMINAFNQTRDFMIRAFNLTEDQAITAITVGIDFGVDQVVDGNWGIHAIIPKWMFTNTTDQYAPATFTGSSKPARVELLTSL